MKKLVNGVEIEMSQEEAAEFEAREISVFIPRPAISKSVILSRITDEQLTSALALMTDRQKERWRSPDTPAVAPDDPEIIGLIQAIGADPDVVLALDDPPPLINLP